MLNPSNALKRYRGFTLAELLIALLIIGEIATFTIPKVLSGQANSRNNAIGKETMATLATSYQQLQLNTSGSVPLTTSVSALTQYMNYVKVDTTSSIDSFPGIAYQTFPCSTYTCLRLHNGGLLMLDITQFGTTTDYIDAILDPDGTVTGRGDSLVVLVFYNGRVTQFGDYAGASYTPSWFSY